jgi:hypothetical protein
MLVFKTHFSNLIFRNSDFLQIALLYSAVRAPLGGGEGAHWEILWLVSQELQRY